MHACSAPSSEGHVVIPVTGIIVDVDNTMLSLLGSGFPMDSNVFLPMITADCIS